MKQSDHGIGGLGYFSDNLPYSQPEHSTMPYSTSKYHIHDYQKLSTLQRLQYANFLVVNFRSTTEALG